MSIFLTLRLALNALRLWPHVVLWKAGGARQLVDADLSRWMAILYPDQGMPANPTTRAFLRLMSCHREFRNLFYHRNGRPGRALIPLCRPLDSLYLTTPDIGPGLYLQHGFATIVSARRIGRDCWINQQVTIGYRNAEDAPILGDRVTVNAGAKIIGAVRIGNDVKVGANAVVVKDVPSGVTVVGVPARIVRRDGRRVDEAL